MTMVSQALTMKRSSIRPVSKQAELTDSFNKGYKTDGMFHPLHQIS